MSIKGWGTVTGVKPSARCSSVSCFGVEHYIHSKRVVLTAKPYKGWKFKGWSGACRSRKTKPKCVIDVTRIHANSFGTRSIKVGAKFIAVAPGLAKAHPLPIGKAAVTGDGFKVQVNSVQPAAQLSPPPAPGADYFAANVTVTYTGGGSLAPSDLLWDVIGSHGTTYSQAEDECPYPGVQPQLDRFTPVFSGQSATGYVCWTIAADDGSSLEMYFGPGQPADGTIWFALH